MSRPISLVRWSGCAAALGAVTILVPSSDAFSLLGFHLGLSQRDVRVFNNFGDPEANDNTTPDAQFPGAVGAPLAIWKAVIEWQSELHGDGTGDPSQPRDLGSGGANFDPTWQGAAPDAGGPSDNVVSEMPGSGGGLFAMTEVGAAGWRIRIFADGVVLDDGPDAPVPGAIDLQGLVAHEYGRALGLGHSSVAGATMAPAIVGDGSHLRSIAADDRAGIQAIYGPRTPSKPHVATTLGIGPITIVGSGFAPNGNEVWFTRAGVNATGEPVKVGGLPSTGGGTQIRLPVPFGAGPGDVLVRVPGIGNDRLSNAFPWRPAALRPTRR